MKNWEKSSNIFCLKDRKKGKTIKKTMKADQSQEKKVKERRRLKLKVRVVIECHREY